MEDFYDIGFQDALQLYQNPQLYERNRDYTDGYNDGITVTVDVAKQHSQGELPSTKGIYTDFPAYKRTYQKALKNRGLNMTEYERGYKNGSLVRPIESNDPSYLIGHIDGIFQSQQAYREGSTGFKLNPGHSNEFIKIYNKGRQHLERGRGKRSKHKRRMNKRTKHKRR